MHEQMLYETRVHLECWIESTEQGGVQRAEGEGEVAIAKPVLQSGGCSTHGAGEGSCSLGAEMQLLSC